MKMINDSQSGAVRTEGRPVTIAVAGNPNAGKSTLINAIAGARLHVGNWPGVTVEKKDASFNHRGRPVTLVDLPGTYSLSPYSQEEVIARDYLIRGRPDVIINVVDATNLERNLYLTLQLLELEIPLVLALNVYDEAMDKGLRIDVASLSSLLGVPVVPTVATKKKGTDDLVDAAVELAETPAGIGREPVQYDGGIEEAIGRTLGGLEADASETLEGLPRRWLAIKLIEGDELALMEAGIGASAPFLQSATRRLKASRGEDLESLMADARYGKAAGLTRETLQKPKRRKQETTEKIDAVVLNRYAGIPVFLIAMWLVFKLTFDISSPFTDWIDGAMNGPLKRQAAAALDALGAPGWTVSLLTEGVVAGVGFVLAFVPAIFAMMFFITFLEGSGYMARAAFVMDRAMHAIGLHGKSFIPMLLGFGCNVPAIYATRTLENPRDRILTALLIPMTSCGARLPVYVVFTGAFFADSAGTVLWSLYTLGIALAVVMGLIFKRTLFRGDAPLFIMELPPYRLPSLRSLLIHTWEKGKHFLVKAGTYILAVSILVWFLLNLPWGVADKKDSWLGKTGQAVAPALAPLGFGTWEASASLIGGVIAKEIVVGTMAEVYAAKDDGDTEEAPSLSEDLREVGVSLLDAARDAAVNVVSTFGIASLSGEEDEGNAGLKQVIVKVFTPLSACAFMVFVLLYMPCVVVAIAMRQEFGTWKWFGVAFAYQMVLAWGAACVVYQGGRMIGLT